MPGPSTGGSPPLTHDDYCRIFGRVIFDASSRIASLEQQIGPLYQGFQSQMETLRAQLVESQSRVAELQRSIEDKS